MKMETFLRKRARSSYWQSLYQAAKELRISLLDNTRNLSGIQLVFLYYLGMYEQLYQSLDSEEFLDIEVINNDLRTDCYLLLKKEERKLERIKRMKDKIKGGLKGNPQHVEETLFYKKSGEKK